MQYSPSVVEFPCSSLQIFSILTVVSEERLLVTLVSERQCVHFTILFILVMKTSSSNGINIDQVVPKESHQNQTHAYWIRRHAWCYRLVEHGRINRKDVKRELLHNFVLAICGQRVQSRRSFLSWRWNANGSFHSKSKIANSKKHVKGTLSGDITHWITRRRWSGPHNSVKQNNFISENSSLYEKFTEQKKAVTQSD